MRLLPFAFLLLLACGVASITHSQEPPATDQRMRIFNVRDYGAVLDGKTDDAKAIMAAYAAMKVNGHPFGTLLIPGVARITSILDLDGGYRNVPSEGQWSTGAGEDFRITVAGALRADPGIKVAVKLHGARNVRADIRFDKGGRDDDIGLQVEDLDMADIGVTGTDFAGTLLYADASTDKTKRIRSTKIREAVASNCGRAIYWSGIEAFGSFEYVWDRNCKHGSHFVNCADTTIKYYENFSPDTQDIGLHFEECNMFSVGVISMGDRAKEALVQITGGNFGSIQRLRASGRPDRPSSNAQTVGLKLVNVKSVNIDNLQTFRCRIGLYTIGSSCNIKLHYSMTGDINPLVVEGTPQFPAPRIDIGAFYRYTMRESVKVADSVTGGVLHLHGTLYDMNIDNTQNELYAVDCRSKGMTLDVAGLTLENRGNLRGAINHPNPAKIIGVTKASIGNPVEHGEIAEATLQPGTVLRNDSPQTLLLWVTVRYAPKADASASFRAAMGPTAEKLAPIIANERAAGSAVQQETIALRISPWWQYRVDMDNAQLVRIVSTRE